MGITENVTDTWTNFNHSYSDFNLTYSSTVTPVFSLNTTTFSNSTNSTEGIDDGQGASGHSHFNFAFIPIVVVLIIAVIACLRCCKWFRKYTRADKSDKAFYTVVDPDDELAIEMSPDSAYDSSTSLSRPRFATRSFRSIRRVLMREPVTAGTSSSTSDSTAGDQIEEPTESFTPIMETPTKHNDTYTRKSSSSSSQTTMTTCSESEAGNSTDAFRRPARFRVSFVAEVRNENDLHFSKLNKRNINNARTSPDHSIESSQNDAQRTDCVHCLERKISVLLKDVGTQTNKSFIYFKKFSKHYKCSDNNNSLIDSNDIGNANIHKGKRLVSKTKNVDMNTQTISENNNKIVNKMCNGSIPPESSGQDFTVVQCHVTPCSNSPTKADKQNGQIHIEMVPLS